ncbi:MAG: site-2 protease family protein [Candidatus Andersenbacteria bacterium]|nr:site-2 protease family protein [bacterium]MDZ4225762.1 site-2 protease family protein [Candidatus Andersenbacteria bacterium]
MMLQAFGFSSGVAQGGALLLGFLIAVIFHEVSHGVAALRLGDPTAKLAGRLTLNPIAHIDLWGTIIIPVLLYISQIGIIFGWAKPVPVNYYNLRRGKWGPLIVALAGPMTNFLLLAIFGGLARIAPASTELPALLATIALINGILMLFNLIPVPPLDGSKVLYLFLEKRPDVIAWMERYGLILLLVVLFFGGSLLTQLVFLPTLRLTSLFSGFSVTELISLL